MQTTIKSMKTEEFDDDRETAERLKLFCERDATKVTLSINNEPIGDNDEVMISMDIEKFSMVESNPRLERIASCLQCFLVDAMPIFIDACMEATQGGRIECNKPFSPTM